jgi:hypothetical protein
VRVADARRALDEMALLDDRFAWHVITHVIASVVSAWRDACETGVEAPLLRVASPAAARALLGDGIVVRGTSVVSVTPLKLRAPALFLEVRLRARFAGSLRREREFGMRWRLVAEAERPGGWRLEAVLPRRLADALADGPATRR